MEFPNNYFEDEVREGFYIPSKMKIYWAAQLELLSYIDSICERYNLQYFANYGTLLGAIRHRGYIPWDDDLDICMRRADAEKLVSYARQELPGEAFALTYEEDDYSNLLIRVVNGRGINFTDDFLERYHGCPYVVGIDIFVLDNMAPDMESDRIQCEDIRRAFELAALVDDSTMDIKHTEAIRKEYCDMCAKYRADIEETYSLKKKLHLLGERIMTYYNDYNSECIADFGNRIHSGKHSYPTEYFEKSFRVPFENTTICVPTYYNSILTRNYGQYMQVVRGGARHGYPVYSIQDRRMAVAIGYEWKEPKFNPDRFKTSRELPSKTYVSRFYTVMSEYLKIISQINNLIPKLLLSNDIENILKTLENAQTVAQKAGESIENNFAEVSDQIVPQLEKYCENIYIMYSYLNGADINIDFAEWREQNRLMETMLINFVEEYKHTLTILVTSRNTENIDFPIDILSENSKTNYIYLTIPFSFKSNVAESVISEEYKKPQNYLADIIVTDEPFGEDNLAYSIPREFYPESLRAFCNYLIVAPRSKYDVFGEKDTAANVTLRYMLCNEGSSMADMIIVPYHNMEQVYEDCLTGYSGESFRERWNKKLFVCEKPDEKNVKSDKRKTLCFHFGVGAFLENKDLSVNKLERTIDLFAERGEAVRVVWVEEKYENEFIKANFPEIASKYGSINLKGIEYRIIDCRSDEDMQIVNEFDAYYGEAGALAHKFIMKNKPVMIMNVKC